MHMALIEMGHTQPPTSEVMDSSTWYRFVIDNIYQRCSRAIDMRFYWVRDRFRQGQFMVYWMAGEHNMEDYFTNRNPNSHHQSYHSTYLIPTLDASKYACYILPINLWGCVESLPVQGNIQRTEKFSHLHVKEMDDGHMDTNSPNRQTRYRRI